MTPAVTVIIPTHDHASTLDLAVASVLEQSIGCLELVVIGDGVRDDTREVIRGLDDRRIRFVDEPKTRSRAELVRHRVLSEAESDYVCYLGDDDVMVGDHIEEMVEALHHVDFAHPLPLYVSPDGSLRAHPTDLSLAECRDWHLHPARNAVSLSGVAHRLDAYRRLPTGWREAPQGRWSDHYMWEQWFRAPGFRFATLQRLTILKFESAIRPGWTPAQRRDEVLAWMERSAEDDFSLWLQGEALACFHRSASVSRCRGDQLADVMEAGRAEWMAQRAELESERGSRAGREAALEAALAQVGALQTEVAELDRSEQGHIESVVAMKDRARRSEERALQAESEYSAISSTRTWKMHDRVVGSHAFGWLSARRRR